MGLGNSILLSNGKIVVSSSASGVSIAPQNGNGVLNFLDGFESYPVGGGIAGQNGWTVNGTPAPSVITGSAIEGIKALSLRGGNQPVSVTILQNASDSVVWSDIQVKPVFYSDGVLPNIDPTSAAAFCFGKDGGVFVYDGKSGWIKGKTVSPINPANWQRVTTMLDYGTQTWSMWVNGSRIASGLAFANLRPSFQILRISNAGRSATLLDAIHLTASQLSSLDFNDGSYFEQKEVSGDFDIQIKMPNISGGNSATIGGLMVREGAGSAARFVSLGATAEGIIKLQARTSGVQATQTVIGSMDFPEIWLRIRREGNIFKTFTSFNGTDWSDAAQLTISDAAQSWVVGLFLNSGIAGKEVQATFEDSGSLANPATPTKGQYFYKREYTDTPLPDFATTRNSIPTPVLDGNPEWVDLYWNAWNLAYQHYRKPSSGSALVSNYMDEAFDTNTIYQWDTIFMTFFGRYNRANFPAIESLDNFYHAQQADGFIARSFDEFSGTNANEGPDSVNPPLFAWAEWENYCVTGDTTRLSQVTLALERYGQWLEANRVKAGTSHGLFFNTPLGSGMDNTPRSGSGWVDMSCQMALHYHYLSRIFDALGQLDKATFYAQKANDLTEKIDLWMWDDIDEQYYDVTDSGSLSVRRTIASFWPLLIGETNRDRIVDMVAHLRDASTFGRLTPFPSLSADDPLYNSLGDYWRGGVWAPTTYAVIKGLEESGFPAMAKESAEKYLTALAAVYQSTGTLWENYAPDSLAKGNRAFSDFVGWSGLGPIALLIENVIGLEPDAANNTLIWNLRRIDRHGIQHYRLGNNDISAIAESRTDDITPASITVQSTEPFALRVKTAAREITFHLAAGSHTLSTADGVLQAPTGLVATRTSPKQASLSWSDSNTDELGYRVYRKAASDPAWDEAAWQLIGETAANGTTFVDDLPGAQGAGYRYMVRAFNDDELSPTSQEAAVTTVAPVASFSTTATNFDISEDITFDASGSADAGGSVIGWSWNFGDGQTNSSGPSVSHQFLHAGSYRIKLTVTSSSGIQNETSKVIVISDIANVKHVLYVTGSAELNSAEKELEFQLESRGFEVLVKTGNAVGTGDASGEDLVIISSSVASTDVNTKFRTVKVPVLIYENQLFDDMGMTDTASTEFGNVSNQTAIDIVGGGSALAAGLSTGSATVYIQPSFMSWGHPGANAIKVASITGDSSKIALFGYDVGVDMVGLVAPERRVGIFLENEGGGLLTQAGLDLFNASVDWLVNQKPSVQLTAPSLGTNTLYGDPVTVVATASDNDGIIAKVEFFDGAKSLGVATTAPYVLVASNLGKGNHVLTAVATDNRGGMRTSAAVPIVVFEGTYRDLWKRNYFTAAELVDPKISGALADPDADGLSNLLEFALNGNPRSWDIGVAPSVQMTAVAGKKYLTLSYTRPKNAADVTYRPEVSGDLSIWYAGPTATAEIGSIDNGTTQTVSVRDLTDTEAASRRFIRLAVSDSNPTYSQNFDSLPGSPNGSDIVWTNNSTLPAWYANRNQLRISDGSGASLDSAGFARLISFGTASNADRALGASHHTFSADTTVFGVRFVNNTGKTLDHFTATFDGEQWRRANVTNPSNQSLTFQYAINPVSLTNGTYLSVPGLSFESIDDGGNGSGGAGLNGNTISLRRISATVTHVSWAPGASLWLRWSDIDDAGVNDHGLGIDNFEFSTDFDGMPAASDSQGNLTLP
jgi:PKD repeat protein